VLRLAFGLLCAAAAIGGGLAVVYLRDRPTPQALAALHGILGAASLALLLAAMRRGLPAHGMGTAGFGPTAAALLALALTLGFFFALRRRRPAGALVGAHAGVAIAALVLLLTLVALD
jgi:hypothetical protein